MTHEGADLIPAGRARDVGQDTSPSSTCRGKSLRVMKVFDAPLVEIIDGTGAVLTPSAKLLRNRRFRVDLPGHAHGAFHPGIPVSSAWDRSRNQRQFRSSGERHQQRLVPLVSPHRKRTKPSPSLFRSTEERRSPESCSSFRSREQQRARFTTVVLGCRT